MPVSMMDQMTDSMIKQPEAWPFRQDQLVAEMKGIYAGLVMVESKCIEVDNSQIRGCSSNNQWKAPVSSMIQQPEARPINQGQPIAEVKGIHAGLVTADKNQSLRLSQGQWQALIALHRTLLHEHHHFFLASQHPSISLGPKRLVSKCILHPHSNCSPYDEKVCRLDYPAGGRMLPSPNVPDHLVHTSVATISSCKRTCTVTIPFISDRRRPIPPNLFDKPGLFWKPERFHQISWHRIPRHAVNRLDENFQLVSKMVASSSTLFTTEDSNSRRDYHSVGFRSQGLLASLTCLSWWLRCLFAIGGLAQMRGFLIKPPDSLCAPYGKQTCKTPTKDLWTLDVPKRLDPYVDFKGERDPLGANYIKPDKFSTIPTWVNNLEPELILLDLA